MLIKFVILHNAWVNKYFLELSSCYSFLLGPQDGFYNTQTFITVPQVLSLCLEDSQRAEWRVIMIYVWEEEPQSFYLEFCALH